MQFRLVLGATAMTVIALSVAVQGRGEAKTIHGYKFITERPLINPRIPTYLFKDTLSTIIDPLTSTDDRITPTVTGRTSRPSSNNKPEPPKRPQESQKQDKSKSRSPSPPPQQQQQQQQQQQHQQQQQQQHQQHKQQQREPSKPSNERAPAPNRKETTSQKTGRLETTTQDRSIITAPLITCPEGQRMNPDRQCEKAVYVDPEGED